MSGQTGPPQTDRIPLVELPKTSLAPRSLHTLRGPCGPLAAWGVLQHFNKWKSATRLIKAYVHSKQDGVFTIALAIALSEHALSVEFYSDYDPAPHPIEEQFYRRAAELGIYIRKPPKLTTILSLVSPDCIPIIIYNTDNGIAHFSPITGVEDDQVILPYSDERRISKAKLQRRWSAPGICRQCILVRQDG